jgi:hypothetical protein
MSSLTLNSTNGVKPHSQPWLTLSVQKFFSAINWDDNPPELQEMKLTASQTEGAPLSLILTVHQFFSSVNWEGAAIASVPTVPEAPASSAPSVDKFTLDDFSDLF